VLKIKVKPLLASMKSRITYLFTNTSCNPLQEACPAFRKPPGLEKIFITGWFNTIMVQFVDTVLACLT
jgi:hypothetical protein